MYLRSAGALLLALLTPAFALAEDAKPTPTPSAEPAKLDPKVNEGKLPGEYRNLPLLFIPKRKAPAELKGDLSDPVWKEAASYELKECASGAKLKYATTAYFFCTDDALYIGVKCAEPKPAELVETPTIWDSDEIELFIEGDKDTLQKPYHQLLVSAGGKHQQLCHHLYRQHGYASLPGQWQGGVEVSAAKGADNWSVEVKVSYENLNISDAAKKKDTPWRMNLYRNRPARADQASEEAAFSPPGVVDFHAAAKFGYILPESNATPELIERLKKEAAEFLAAQGKQIDPAGVAEVDKLVGELNSDQFEDRNKASTRLLEIAGISRSHADAVSQTLSESIEKNPDPDLVSTVKDLLKKVKLEDAKREGQVDPPPDNIKAQMGMGEGVE